MIRGKFDLKCDECGKYTIVEVKKYVDIDSIIDAINKGRSNFMRFIDTLEGVFCMKCYKEKLDVK
jgi:hypothetical protein